MWRAYNMARASVLEPNSGNFGGVSQDVVFLPDAAAITLAKSDSGKIHLCPDLTADATISLPSEERGLAYELWYGGTAADAQDWIITSGDDTNFFIGGLVQHDTDDGGDDTKVVDSDNDSNSKLSILTPIAGTYVKLICDGVNWYVNGSVISATDTAIVFADQS